jgi:hypothetical protein
MATWKLLKLFGENKKDVGKTNAGELIRQNGELSALGQF